MSTRAIKPKRDDATLAGEWRSIRERAPSILRADQPVLPRVIALVSLLLVTLGGASLVFPALGREYLLDAGWGVCFLGLGAVGLFYHAFREQELQYRRLYGAFGAALLLAGVLFRFLPIDGVIGGSFMRFGVVSLIGAWAFLLAFARNESEPYYRNLTINVIGIVGLLSALAGVIGGWRSEAFLVGHGGVLHLVFGLLYLATYAGMQEAGSRLVYWTGIAFGVIAGLLLLAPVTASILPWLLNNFGLLSEPPVDTFMMPRGLIFFYFAIEYGALALGICSESKVIAITRRELAAFFYSPIAYIVLVAIALVSWWQYSSFLERVLDSATDPRMGALPEPIIAGYLVDWPPIICYLFMVPLLTMGLMSEEKRTGTLEMLLTVPVNEVPIVLGKFLAVLRIFLLSWYPAALFLIALRAYGGEEFDYRPMLTFFIALTAIGAGALSMGLFFSALTRNQIIAAVITFAFMVPWTFLFFLYRTLPEESVWHTILSYILYIPLWITSMNGTLTPRYLLFHISAAVLFLFLTVKVLESRKWR